MNKILDEAKAIQNEIITNRRYLHQYAELGNNLPITTKYVVEKLKKMGYEPEIIADSAIVAFSN